MTRHYNTFSGRHVVSRARPVKARKSKTAEAPLRAAQYVRMSTEHQKYSTRNQSVTNHAYAKLRGIEIVRTYADEGKSGLTASGRHGLRQLMGDVQSGRADFDAIFVYDVSRWGRFPDPDEAAAYYEYTCKRARIKLHYCAEEFENDGSLFAAVAKNLKRAMAGEYSRELSVKAFAGQRRLVKLGFSAGASPGYALRRMLVDENGVPKFLLGPGQRKSIMTDRVVLVPGPPEEIKVVRWVFQAAARRKSEHDIADLLNRRKISAARGCRWTAQRVHRTLTNEKYIGNLVWHRESIKLTKERVFNDPKDWIRAEGAIEPIVRRNVFAAAQVALKERRRPPMRDDRLRPLRRLLKEHGYLHKRLIDNAPGVPSANCYQRWFGGLLATYKLVGYTGHRPYCRRRGPLRSHHAVTRKLSSEQMIHLLRAVLHKNGRLTRKIVDETNGVPSATTYCKRFGSIERAYRLAGYLSDDHFLDMLRAIMKGKGYLSQCVINATPGIPHSRTYARRFGSMARVYELIGYVPADHEKPRKQRPRPCRRFSKRDRLDALRQLWRRHGRLSTTIIGQAEIGPSYTTLFKRFGSLHRAYRLIGYKPECRSSIRSIPSHWRRTADGGTIVRNPFPDPSSITGDTRPVWSRKPR